MRKKLLLPVILLVLMTLACGGNSNTASVNAVVVNSPEVESEGTEANTANVPAVGVEIIQTNSSSGGAEIRLYPEMPISWQELDLVFEPIEEITVGSFELTSTGYWKNRADNFSDGDFEPDTFLEVHTTGGSVHRFMCIEPYEEWWGTGCYTVGIAIEE